MNFNFGSTFGLPTTQTLSSSSSKVEQLIEENNQLLLLSMEALSGKLDTADADVSPSIPYLQKLQKNLLHLALLAEQLNPVPIPSPAVPVQISWTHGDMQKLKELIYTVGEDPLKLAQFLGKPVDTVNLMLKQLKQHSRSLV